MSFDEVLFPLQVSYGSQGGIQFLTEVVSVNGGYEQRNQKWSQARRCYNAATGVVTISDAVLLASFFQSRKGQARGFRLRDWMDYSSAPNGVSTPSYMDQEIATGDAVTTSFQLIKTYGSSGTTYVRDVKKPVELSVLVAINSVLYETGWSLDYTTGIITFSQAPSNGARITAGYLFDVPVRFDTDILNLSSLDKKLVDTEIPLIEVRV